MKNLLLLFILTLFIGLESVQADVYRRNVEFDWEEVEGAKIYEVELVQVLVDKMADQTESAAKIHKVKEAKWSGLLEPGNYKMRLRTRDYRGVPGPWSDVSEFPVTLEKLTIQAPVDQSQVQSKDDSHQLVKFQWSPVGGASRYVFELKSQDGTIAITEDLKKPFYEAKLPVALSYSWNVKAYNEKNISNASPTEQSLTILGPTLATPEISKPETGFVREVRWEKPSSSQNFDVTIHRFDEKTKKLELFKEIKNSPDEFLVFENEWTGGIYQVSVRATASGRGSSNWSKQRFKVLNGDRSPAAEYIATVRRSIERVSGWYAIASYLVTEVKYGNSSADKNTFLNLNAIGGTGRVGAGWFHPNSSWGFLGIADFSGLTVQGKTYTYSAAELNAVYKKAVSDRTEVRFLSGAFFKESPELVASSNINSYEASKVVTVGPHIGLELWYSMTPKLGLQLHAHTYGSAIGLDTPNGQSLNPTFSTQVGAMGSYRFTSRFTGLVGFTLREDKTSYSRSSESTFTQSNNNESKISGNYLNFYAEWAF